jgi:hypothetical protein
MAERLTANALAADLIARGRGGQWLSVKQTAFLIDLAGRDLDSAQLAPGGARGVCDTAEGRAHWSIQKSPINGAGFLSVTAVSTDERLRPSDSGYAEAMAAISDLCDRAEAAEGTAEYAPIMAEIRAIRARLVTY